jgi:16S rRNA (guanine527-N7)-methyltransferase
MTREELAEAGFSVASGAYARLSGFVELLLRENERVNLTAIRNAAEVWRLHVCESLSLMSLVEDLRPRRLLDLGTGGGIPGIPLACVADDLDVTLLDATRKKLDAVERITNGIGLEHVHALWGRAETLAHETAHRETFDVVTARAVAALPTLVEYAAGFVRPGGQCWFAKPAEVAAREVEAARNAATRCNLEHQGSQRLELPGGTETREVVIYVKRAPLGRGLPRPPGRPRRKPL